MSYLSVLFPEGISYGASGGPVYSTQVVQGRNGAEQRNILWSSPLRRWEVGRYAYNEDLIAELISFWHVVAGRAYSFRFRDWQDDQAGGGYDASGAFVAGTPQVIGTGNGSTTAFQLKKSYTFGAQSSTRVITKPMPGAKIYLAGVLQTSGYTLNEESGIVTFTSPPSSSVAVAWAGQFWVECRFDSDAQQLSFESMTSADWTGIQIVEVRP
jgi:uncharacterized protein (TIGR02217 family)